MHIEQPGLGGGGICARERTKMGAISEPRGLRKPPQPSEPVRLLTIIYPLAAVALVALDVVGPWSPPSGVVVLSGRPGLSRLSPTWCRSIASSHRGSSSRPTSTSSSPCLLQKMLPFSPQRCQRQFSKACTHNSRSVARDTPSKPPCNLASSHLHPARPGDRHCTEVIPASCSSLRPA